MFADMIPPTFIDKLTAILAWLAARLAEIRERNALRDQAALDQAGDDQTDIDQAALDPTRAGALPAVCPLSPPGPAPSSAPDSHLQSPLPSRPDSDSFPHSPPALSSAAALVAPAAAAVPAPRPGPCAEESVAARPSDGHLADCQSPTRADPAPAWLEIPGEPRATTPLAVATPARVPGALLPLGHRAGGERRRRHAVEGFFRDRHDRARVPARHLWPAQAADPARVRGAEPVGWNPNSAPTRRGLCTT